MRLKVEEFYRNQNQTNKKLFIKSCLDNIWSDQPKTKNLKTIVWGVQGCQVSVSVQISFYIRLLCQVKMSLKPLFFDSF